MADVYEIAREPSSRVYYCLLKNGSIVLWGLTSQEATRVLRERSDSF